MIKFGVAHNVIDDETVQVMDLDNDELYEVKGNDFSIGDIKLFLEKKMPCVVEYDDETLRMVE